MIRPYKYLLLACCCYLTTACKKNEVPPPAYSGPVTQVEINNWILDSMRYFYLWNQELPATVNNTAGTIAFFTGLKNKEDHFSLLYDADNLVSYPSSMLYTFGMEFSIIAWPQAPAGALGVIKLIVPGSQADKLGLKRGDYFIQINNTVVNSSNATTLSNTLLQDASGSITTATLVNQQVTMGNTLSLQGIKGGENAIYAQHIFQQQQKHVGYIFYNTFNDTYNQDLLYAFEQFKSQQVTELILDLRYNSGGSISAAAVLATLIAPGIKASTNFLQYKGNQHLGSNMQQIGILLAVPERGTPVAFNTLVPGMLALPRVFILTGNKTVSAAELLINCLKPYMQVIQIGQTTYGKDKGAIIIKDTRQPKRISWVLQPITYNLTNAKGEGGYTNGIVPQYLIDEMSMQPLPPIGEKMDPLIAKALQLISGSGRQTAHPTNTTITTYYDSEQTAAAGSRLIVPPQRIR
jgi:carboxyl-terminal processing protease